MAACSSCEQLENLRLLMFEEGVHGCFLPLGPRLLENSFCPAVPAKLSPAPRAPASWCHLRTSGEQSPSQRPVDSLPMPRMGSEKWNTRPRSPQGNPNIPAHRALLSLWVTASATSLAAGSLARCRNVETDVNSEVYELMNGYGGLLCVTRSGRAGRTTRHATTWIGTCSDFKTCNRTGKLVRNAQAARASTAVIHELLEKLKALLRCLSFSCK